MSVPRGLRSSITEICALMAYLHNLQHSYSGHIAEIVVHNICRLHLDDHSHGYHLSHRLSNFLASTRVFHRSRERKCDSNSYFIRQNYSLSFWLGDRNKISSRFAMESCRPPIILQNLADSFDYRLIHFALLNNTL